MKKLTWLHSALLIVLLCSPLAYSFDLSTERYRLSGFGTLAVTSAGREQFGIQKNFTHDAQFGDVSVLADSVFGLQLDVNLFEDLSATVQAIAKDQAKQNFNNVVDWAYLSYRPTRNITIRAGRMGIDLFMLSEYRNVNYAYLWTHPVVEFYKPIGLSHYEGFDFKYARRIKPGFFEFKVYGGQTGANLNITDGNLALRMRPFVGANATLESDNWKVRLTYATTDTSRLDTPFQPLLDTLGQVPQAVWPQAASLQNRLTGKGKQTHYYSIGFAYDDTQWTVQSEFAMMSSRWVSLDMTNGYLSVGKRIGPVTLYTVGSFAKSLDRLRVDRPVISNPELDFLATTTQLLADASHTDQNTISLGARWDFYPKMALKVQWDHTWVRKRGGGLLLLRSPLEQDTTFNTFSINLSFMF